ncbi:multicopper oxidase-domain-containing protein [Aspergillus pseudoustus]|uniref:Multicopper oxidase-domain-containing protein n=1 Tax=Aspergillus pseudoustus TaxID=1810923 RepID=A0ABR4J1L8_9EURO
MGLFRGGLLMPALLLYIVSFVYGYGEIVKRTGNTVSFQVSLTWEDWQPAGIPRKMILANSQFPAAPLELKQGDDVEFLVTNNMPFSTSVHFHGIEQQDTPWSDGVPGLSQMPIAPGDSFLYKWRATNYGSYFYHAHKRGQQEDGMYGAIHIRPDASIEKPFALIAGDNADLKAMENAESNTTPILLSDVRQLTSEQLWQAEIAGGRDAFCANALLVNGKGTVTCLGRQTIDESTTIPQRMVLGNQSLTDTGCLPPTNEVAQGNYPHNISAFPPSVFSECTPSYGMTERLYPDASQPYVSYDLVSAAVISTISFAIDEHPLYVYAIDGHYVEPTLVDTITLTNGARYSVLVKLDKPAGDYTIRVANNGVNQILNGSALMTYHNGAGVQQRPSEPSISIVGAPTSSQIRVLNESTIVPFPSQAVSEVQVAQTHVLRIHRHGESYLWTLGNSSFPLSLEEAAPLLFYPSTGEKDLTIRTNNGTWVDLIFDVDGDLQPPHPIHKHSNKFFVLGQGDGKWNYSSVTEAAQIVPESFNFETPQIRDTFVTPPAAAGPTWLALRYHVVNPGAFLLHCHIQVHLNGGMALALLDGVDEWPEVPEEYQIS